MKKINQNSLQDKEISKLWKAVSVINHNTTTIKADMATIKANIKWLTTILLLILGCLIKVSFQ